MKKALKIIGAILAVILLIGVGVYMFVLQYPKLKENPKVDKWYRVTSKEMKSSDGSDYRAFFKKGSENKVLVYFAGGGVSINAETAKEDMYNKKMVGIDMLANVTMNMGGLATAAEGNLFKDWTVIMFPYATGDFHAGTSEFKYTDNNGNEQTLYHYGYKNYRAVMKIVMERAGIDNPEAVVVTGYSAGGGGASLLANDVFTNYFPNAKSKTVLIDAMLLLNDDWKSIATDVWETPKEISNRINTDNLVLDSLVALHKDFGNGVNILFDSSTRDGDLAKVQNYFDTGVLDVDERKADKYQQTLKENITKFKEQAGAYVFIWDGLPWYDDPRNLTMHTIIATPYVWQEFADSGKSVGEWLNDAVNGKLVDYGLDLLDKTYEYTE